MITVVDYGVGNLFSLVSSLKYLGLESEVTGDPDRILGAEKLILPGVGAFGDAIGKLRSSGLCEAVMEFAASKRPLLGICVGMQMLFEESLEYGRHQGLGLLPGSVASIEEKTKKLGLALKVPQIGWNSLKIFREDCPVLSGTRDGEFVYYVHSYYVRNCGDALAAGSEYGVLIPGVVWKDNVFGSQFHPEKSGAAGLRFLRTFCEM